MMISPGVILMQRNASHPNCFQMQEGPCPRGWMQVSHTLSSRELDVELGATGWTFFYMASPIRTNGYGFHSADRIAAAMKRVVAHVRFHKCNCLQIDEVVTRSFLGVPYVSVAAHPRHIQRGNVFAGQ